MEETHPSYGMLEINRISCNRNVPLFGSSIVHNNMIELVIREAEVDRKYHKEYYLGRKKLISINMSYSQFMQAIISANTSGTPVTIKNFDGKDIEQKSILDSKKDLFEKEFQESIDKIFDNSVKTVKMASDFLEQTKPLTKTQKEELYNLLYKINQDLKENLKFILKSFKEQMDITITESHGEIEAFFDMKIKSLGIESFQNKLIELKEEVDGE